MAENVFQMLAQQEIDKPHRDLQRLQVQQQQMALNRMMQEQAYQQKAQTDLAAMPQGTQTTQTLGSLGPQGQPFNPVAPPQMASMDPNAQGGSLALMGLNVNPMQQTEQKPNTILEGFQREYNYHNANGRPDLARKVHDDQLKYTLDVAKVVDELRKQPGGPANVLAWMRANPEMTSVLGDPSTVKIGKDGAWYPVTKNDSNEIIPGRFWSYDGKGGVTNHEIKPEPLQTATEGSAVLGKDGKWTIPAPKAEKPDQEALLDKRFANQQALQAQQIAAQDRRSGAQIAAMLRKGGSGGGGGGKPPIGYRYTGNGDLEPIPGGPADQKVTQAVKAQEGAVQAIDTGIASVKELLNHPGRKASTGASSLTNAIAIPGGNAKTFLHKLDTFKSQMFIPMVQQIKGMGALSDAEGKKLTAAVGALEPSMGEQDFVDSLNTILSELEMTRNRTAQPISGAATGRGTLPSKPSPRPASGGNKTAAPRTASDYMKKFNK